LFKENYQVVVVFEKMKEDFTEDISCRLFLSKQLSAAVVVDDVVVFHNVPSKSTNELLKAILSQ
jgi:hypothetical protein